LYNHKKTFLTFSLFIFAEKYYTQHIDRGRRLKVGGTMVSAESEPVTRVMAAEPPAGPGAEPLVRGPGSEATLKLKHF